VMHLVVAVALYYQHRQHSYVGAAAAPQTLCTQGPLMVLAGCLARAIALHAVPAPARALGPSVDALALCQLAESLVMASFWWMTLRPRPQPLHQPAEQLPLQAPLEEQVCDCSVSLSTDLPQHGTNQQGEQLTGFCHGAHRFGAKATP